VELVKPVLSDTPFNRGKGDPIVFRTHAYRLAPRLTAGKIARKAKKDLQADEYE